MNFHQPEEVLTQSPYVFEDSVVNFDYPVHLFLVDPFEGDSPAIQILYITEFDGRTLVALPHTAWHRLVTKRAFPSAGFTKGILLEVVASRQESRSIPDPEQKMRLWVGYLKSGFEKHIHTDITDFKCDHFFGENEDNPWMPYAQSLIEVAQDHFACFSAAEGEMPPDEVENGSEMDGNELLPDVGSPEALEDRVRQLETTLQSVHASMEEMLRLQKGMPKAAPSQTVRPSALRKKEVATSMPGAVMRANPKPKSKDKFPLLDQGVVQAALQSGVGEESLLEMQRLIGSNTKAAKMPDLSSKVGLDPLSEEEDAAITAAQNQEGGGLEPEREPSDPVHSALHKLTSIMEVLTTERTKKQAGSKLDQALDSVASSSRESQGLGSGKKCAAARRALRTIFQDQPQEISAVIERLMFEDLNSQTLGPGQMPKGLNARAWVEFRSRIGNYKTPAHCSWAAAGILDALVSGDVARARARCGLLLLQLDQSSIDRGGWGLASELSLEGLPPYSALATHSVPLVSEGEQPFSKLLDSRWAEICLQYLKEQDEYLVRRKNIGRMTSNPGTKLKEGEETEVTDPPRRRPPKVKAKAKPAASQQE